MERSETSVADLDLDMILLYSIRAGTFLVCLMPLVVTTATLFPFIVGKAVYSRTIIEVVVGLWLVLAHRNPAYRPARTWILVAFGVWLAVGFLAGFAGVSLTVSLWSTYERMQGMVDLAHWFAFTAVVISVFRSSLSWRVLLSFNLAVSMAMAVLGIGQHFDLDFITSSFSFIGPTVRVESTLGNATYVGAYSMVNILIGLGLLSRSFQALEATSPAPAPRGRRRRRQRRHRRRTDTASFAIEGPALLPWWQLFWAVGIALNIWVMILSLTRGAYIGLFAGLLMLALVYIGWGTLRTVRRLAIVFVVFVVGVGLLVAVTRGTSAFDRVASSNPTLGRIASIGLNDASVKGRLSSWSAGMKGFLAKPVLGWGPENYLIAWGRYFDSSSGVTERFDQAHNKLVEELTTKGVLGFVSYVALWALMFRVVFLAIKEQEGREQLFTLFMGAALVGYFVQNLFLFDTPTTVFQFVLLVGFAANLEATRAQLAGEASDDRQGSSEPGARGDVEAPSPRWQAGPILRLLGLVAVLPLLALSIYLFNVRTYQAASAVVKTSNPNITWEQRFGYFDESIDAFPALANYPRLILMSQITSNWRSVSAANEAMTAIEMIEREARDAVVAEPEGWRTYLALSRLYQVASSVDPAYLELARTNLEIATELAPDAPEVSATQVTQAQAEEEYGGAP